MSSLFDKFKEDNFELLFQKASEGTTKNGGGEGSVFTYTSLFWCPLENELSTNLQ